MDSSLKFGKVLATSKSSSIVQISTDYCLIKGEYNLGDEVEIVDDITIKTYPSLMNLFVGIVEDNQYSSDEETMLASLIKKR